MSRRRPLNGANARLAVTAIAALGGLHVARNRRMRRRDARHRRAARGETYHEVLLWIQELQNAEREADHDESDLTMGRIRLLEALPVIKSKMSHDGTGRVQKLFAALVSPLEQLDLRTEGRAPRFSAGTDHTTMLRARSRALPELDRDLVIKLAFEMANEVDPPTQVP